MSAIRNAQDHIDCRYKSRVNEQKSYPPKILCLCCLRKSHYQSIVWAFFITSVVPCRSESPHVPAVRNRLLQVQRREIHVSHSLVHKQQGGREEDAQADSQQSSPAAVPEAARPPSAQFVPYVRTREVYCLQPEAPLSQPSAHHPHCNGTAMVQGQQKCYSHLHGSAAALASFIFAVLLNCAVISLWHSSAPKGCAARLYSAF